ncbi:MAG: pyridoxal-phosphate dependent enzyme [Kofleriaceae bacterium]
MSGAEPALHRIVPAARARIPWAALGAWPTAVEPCQGELVGQVWLKREDRSSPRYGGNKVRTLEAVLGDVIAGGHRRLWATGAYGSNHTLATAIHGADLGLDIGALVFPQPPSEPARDNLAALAATGATVQRVTSVLALPWAMARVRRTQPDAAVMPPGGATPVGAVGALSAALELAEQVAAGAMPAPARVVLPTGSVCTAAGLLAGVHLAAARGLGWRRPPLIHAVRVTPWPVTSAWRITHLAAATLARLDARLGVPLQLGARQLRSGLRVDGSQLGPGYGHPTTAGGSAAAWLAAAGAPPLDDVYAAKAAAALRATPTSAPTVFWVTKSSAPLPEPSAADLARLDPALLAWLRR